MRRSDAQTLLAKHEGIDILSLPRNERWACLRAILVLHPCWLVKYVRHRLWFSAPWPGDRWFNILRYQEGVVVRVDREGVLLEVGSYQMIDCIWRDWPDGTRPTGVVPAYEFVHRGYWGWQPK